MRFASPANSMTGLRPELQPLSPTIVEGFMNKDRRKSRWLTGPVPGVARRRPPHLGSHAALLVFALVAAAACKSHVVFVDASPSKECLAELAAPYPPQVDTAALPSADTMHEAMIKLVRGFALVRYTYQNHDCQELIHNPIHKGPKYVTRAEIYAHLSIETRRDAEFSTNAGFALPVAYLFNIDMTAYDPLSLPASNEQCLFAGVVPAGNVADEDDWFATLATCKNADGTDRPNVAWEQPAAGDYYRVLRLTYEGFDFDAYPPVTRWHWDKRGIFGGRQAMGTKCGNAWCVIGKKKPKIDDRTYGASPRQTVPGWRDEQHPAIKVGPDSFKVDKVYAVIVPDPHFDPKGDFSNFVHVADVHFDARSSHYQNKFGYEEGVNQVWLKMDAASPTGWVTEIRPPSGRSRRFQAQPHEHPIGAVTARWFWTTKDEHSWTPCPIGCCETTDVPPPP
jgi:hypothetical protein